MKNCEFCNQEYQESTAPGLGKRQKYCSSSCRWNSHKHKDLEAFNAKVRKYRADRTEREGSWRQESTAAKKLQAWLIELKSKPCMRCGLCFDPCCMDFDHREGVDKKYNLGTMFAHHYSVELIQIELDKCDLTCSNCHRIITRERRLKKRAVKPDV